MKATVQHQMWPVTFPQNNSPPCHPPPAGAPFPGIGEERKHGCWDLRPSAWLLENTEPSAEPRARLSGCRQQRTLWIKLPAPWPCRWDPQSSQFLSRHNAPNGSLTFGGDVSPGNRGLWPARCYAGEADIVPFINGDIWRNLYNFGRYCGDKSQWEENKYPVETPLCCLIIIAGRIAQALKYKGYGNKWREIRGIILNIKEASYLEFIVYFLLSKPKVRKYWWEWISMQVYCPRLHPLPACILTQVPSDMHPQSFSTRHSELMQYNCEHVTSLPKHRQLFLIAQLILSTHFVLGEQAIQPMFPLAFPPILPQFTPCHHRHKMPFLIIKRLGVCITPYVLPENLPVILYDPNEMPLCCIYIYILPSLTKPLL